MHEHSAYGFALPEINGRLLDWVGDERRRHRAERALGGHFADWACGAADEEARELGYNGHPFEVVPLLWAGGDALQYGLLVHADAAGVTHPMVSYAPGDEPPGPVWLGDDAAQGLANLLAVSLRDTGTTAPWAHFTPSEVESIRNENAECVAELAEALGLTIPSAIDELTEGARSERMAVPTAPAGWRFEDCNDNVGVLAPEEAFDLTLVQPEEVSVFSLEDELSLAASLLAKGAPASALAVARNAYLFTAYDDDHGIAAARAMRDAYEALGRAMLVRRVDDYIRAHS